MRIGILALQGAFAEHAAMLQRLGADSFEIRKRADLDGSGMDGLIIPGGESTVMTRLLQCLDLFDSLRDRLEEGLPVLGTCAGLILLARQVEGGVPCFGCMDIVAKRNAYGRQLGSFETAAPFAGTGEIPMIFIRGPYIRKAGPEVQILARVNGYIVAARQENMLVTAFHPELTENTEIHEHFLKMAKNEPCRTEKGA